MSTGGRAVQADDRPIALVLRALGLGDLLVSVPALRALRRARPEHRVVLAAPEWLRPVVGLVGSVDALLPVAGLDEPLPPLAGTGGVLDLAVNLHGRGPQSHARLDALAPRHRMGHTAPGWDGPVWVDETDERTRWLDVLRHHGISGDPGEVGLARPGVASPAPGAVVVHVGAAYGSRSWPSERFAVVARRLAATGRGVVLTGSAAERPRAAAVAVASGLEDRANLAGRTGLAELAALVADAALVVTVDTGAAHLASAYGTPSVVLFGPAPVSRWGPPPGPHVVLTDERLRRGDVFAAATDPALLAVSAEDVLAAAEALLRD